MKPRANLRLGAALSAVPLILAACLGGGAATSNPTTAPSAAPPSQDTASGAPSPSEEALSGTVTFWNSYSEGGGQSVVVDTLNQLIASFQSKYPNVTVEHQEIGYNDLRQKLVTGIAAGQLPDVLRADIMWVPEFASDGALLALDQEMPDYQDLAAQAYDGPVSTNIWNGHAYGLPLDTNTRLLFYNQAVFDKAGITQPPATVEEFEAAMAKIKASGGDVSGYAEGGTSAWNILPWIWSFGGGITDASLTKATGTLNGPATVAAVQKLSDWLKAGYLSNGILGGGLGTTDAMGKNSAGMIVDGPWMPPIFAEQYPDLKVGLAPLPAGPGGSISVVGGEDIVVFKQTQNKAAALAFTRFMLSEEAQLAMGKVGNMPVLKSLAGNSELPAYYAVFQQQIQIARARTPSPQWPKIDEAITNGVLKALRGDVSVQQALDEAAATIDGLLDK